jgi:hypothetical protein
MIVKELILLLQECHPKAECSFQYYENNSSGWVIKLIHGDLQENNNFPKSVTFAFAKELQHND